MQERNQALSCSRKKLGEKLWRGSVFLVLLLWW